MFGPTERDHRPLIGGGSTHQLSNSDVRFWPEADIRPRSIDGIRRR